MPKKFFLIIGIILLLIGVRFMYKNAQYFPLLFELLFHKEITLKKAENHNVNILLLGTGGGTHDGPNLTDTIIFASLNTDKNTATLVSIPRDLWITDLKGKINTAYAQGEGKRRGGGLLVVKAAVAKVVKQNVDYAIRIDFNGFVKAVDLVGGLNVNVDRAFDDYQYPVEEKREDLCGHTLEEATVLIATESPQMVFPCRYEHLHFDSGMQHMSGDRALAFVRSRYASGAEGTDFARSKRQEKVITAFKETLFSAGTVLNPTKVIGLYDVLKASIDTDIQQSEFDDFIRLADKMRKAKLQSIVLDYGDESHAGLLVNPPIATYGQWVLIPRKGEENFSEIHSYVACILAGETCTIAPSK